MAVLLTAVSGDRVRAALPGATLQHTAANGVNRDLVCRHRNRCGHYGTTQSTPPLGASGDNAVWPPVLSDIPSSVRPVLKSRALVAVSDDVAKTIHLPSPCAIGRNGGLVVRRLVGSAR